MLLLQEKYKLQLNTLDTEISALYARLIPLKVHKDYTGLKEKLREHLRTFSMAILQKKEKKFWRDKNAFGENRAYRWHQNRTSKNKDKKPTRNQDKNGYNSDTLSNTSFSASSNIDRTLRKRKGPFARQQEMEGELQQINKKPTADAPHTLRGGKADSSSRNPQANNEGTKGSNVGQSKIIKATKDLGAIPKNLTQLDDFLDKMTLTQALSTWKEQEPTPIQNTQ